MALTYVISAALFGAFLLAVAVGVSRGARQRSASTAGFAASTPAEGRSRAEESVPTAWVLGFVLIVLGAGAGALSVLGGIDVPSGVEWFAFGSILVALVAGYLLWGVYQSARYRGLKSAQALGISLWTAGLLCVGAVVLQLLSIG